MADKQSGTVFVFKIINGQVKRAGITGTLLNILAVFIFVTRYLRELSFLNLIIAILLSLLLLWNLFSAKKRTRIPDFIILFFIGIALIFIPLFNLLGVLYLILAFISYRLSKPARIRFADEGIFLQSVWSNSYQWEQVKFVVMKDSLVTIELKNDKLLQFEIEEVAGFDENDFKKYTAQKISKT